MKRWRDWFTRSAVALRAHLNLSIAAQSSGGIGFLPVESAEFAE